MKYPENTIAVLNNENTVITIDDHCYVLKNRINDKWLSTHHIFAEANRILQTLPLDPNHALFLCQKNGVMFTGQKYNKNH
ncbi:MAG: hypothetical protein KDH96_03480 [Candidatus Riesia sp.]|nr:hypothetical protein [Candidatus Riesia sp.]